MCSKEDFLFKDFDEWTHVAEIATILHTSTEAEGKTYADFEAASVLCDTIKILAKGYHDLIEAGEEVPKYRPAPGKTARNSILEFLGLQAYSEEAKKNTLDLIKQIKEEPNGQEA